MDFIKFKGRITECIGKYKYVWIVLLAGMLLMMMPGNNMDNAETEVQHVKATAEELTMQEQLESILCHVEGAGKVKVLLSVSQGERTIYQTDSTWSQSENSSDSRTQTILISDSQRNETGLVHQKNPPVYLGAIVLAQGAESPIVRLAIVDAVGDITGLGADKISVLKMK